MPYYSVSSFFFDPESRNAFIQFYDNYESPYPAVNGDTASEMYEVQVFLDGNIRHVGSYRPASVDGTTMPTATNYGRNGGPPDAVDETAIPLEDTPFPVESRY